MEDYVVCTKSTMFNFTVGYVYEVENRFENGLIRLIDDKGESINTFNDERFLDVEKVVKCVTSPSDSDTQLVIGALYPVVGKDDGHHLMFNRHTESIEAYPTEWFSDVTFLKTKLPLEQCVMVKTDEVEELITSRSNGTYDQIAEDAKVIMDVLGQDDEYTYFYSQVANKLARLKHRYSEEDSLLDIAGYAKLELDRFRKGDK